MIEEAAGTRMYESKKLSAQKTIEKKASKLKEIETVSILQSLAVQKQRFGSHVGRKQNHKKKKLMRLFC